VAEFLIFDTDLDGGIRLAASNLSRDFVIAAVASEPGLGQDEKCRLFLDLFGGRSDWSTEAYRSLGREGCTGSLPTP